MNAVDDAALVARVVVSLIVVVLLALLGARLVRRTGLRGPGRSLRLLERLPLSREAFLAVVAVADRGLVLGVTAHGLQVVGELDAETVAQVYPEPAPNTGSGRGSGPGGRRRSGDPGMTDKVAGVEVGEHGVKVTRVTGSTRTPPARGTGSVLDPRTWRRAVDALRDLTVRRG